MCFIVLIFHEAGGYVWFSWHIFIIRDWYNLEKSKRVKAFRCGEFDDCIERAEAAQDMPPKKREKYARREDAIMHALELERQLVEKKHGNSDNSSWARSKVSPDGATSSNYNENGRENKGVRVYNPEFGNLGSSVCEKNETSMLFEEKLIDGNQLHAKDDSAGLLPQTRGLHDRVLHPAPSSGKTILVATDSSVTCSFQPFS